MKRLSVGCVICFILMAVFFLSLPVWAQEKVVKLRYTNMFPPVHPTSKLSEDWGKEIEKRTSGRVVVTYFHGATLTPPGQTYDSVVKGIADIGQSLTSYSPGRFPLIEAMGLPLGYSSGYQVTKLSNEYYKKFRPKEFGDTEIMYLHVPPPGVIQTRKVVGSIDEIKGFRIKVNADTADIVSAVGAVPVTMPITETYDALSKGLLDGAWLNAEALKGWRFAEVIKCQLDNTALTAAPPFFVTMNKDKWNAISRDDRQSIEKINEEWIEKQALLWNEVEKDAREYAIQKGVKFIKASKEEEAKTAEKMKPIITNWASKMKDKVPTEEALKFLQEWLRAHP